MFVQLPTGGCGGQGVHWHIGRVHGVGSGGEGEVGARDSCLKVGGGHCPLDRDFLVTRWNSEKVGMFRSLQPSDSEGQRIVITAIR